MSKNTRRGIARRRHSQKRPRDFRKAGRDLKIRHSFYVLGDFKKVLPGIQVNFFGVFAAISAARRGTFQKIIRRWRSSVNFFRIRPSILVEFCPVATGSAQHAQQNPKRAQHWRSSENISAQKASVLFSRKFNTNRMKKARITPQILRTVLTIGQPLQMHCKWTVNQR